jgi:hypothetical protein
MRVFDRGGWRPWVVANPSFHGAVAPKVKRTAHAVEIQVLKNGQWLPLYSGEHGSRTFSRVLKIKGGNSNFEFSWYDEMPGTHDLVRSGTIKRLVKTAGVAIVQVIMIGG